MKNHENTYLPGEAFQDLADYDTGIRQIVPFYDQMLDTIARALPGNTGANILELGNGTGELTTKIINRNPASTFLCVDYSQRMTEFMQLKMSRSEHLHQINWILSDFESLSPKIQSELKPDTFDACVSSLALHHLSDPHKEQVFKLVFRLLKPGGHFWIADTVLPESENMNDLYVKAREQWLEDQNLTREQLTRKMVHDKLFKKPDNHNPGTLKSQLAMLEHVGFKNTDILWKYFGMAVFGGVKD